jgi:cysteine-rich repeat protein
MLVGARGVGSLVVLALLSACGAAIGDGSEADDDRDAGSDFGAGVCGDGAIASDEACDDGNTDPLDGCSASCAVEAGWTCAEEPSTCSGESLCPGLPTNVDLSAAPLASCAAFLAEGYHSSGLYALDPDGAGGADAFLAPCDMATADGGWTMLTRNDATDDEPSGCLPRLASGGGQACGTPSCDADFAVPAADLLFTEMVWAAYDASGGILTYTLVRFDDPVTLPATDQWSLTADDFDLELADWATTPRLECNWFDDKPGLRRIANETPNGTTGGYPDNLVVTFFDQDDDDSNPGKMSFTDAENSATASAKGLDDFQDGYGCGDEWTPRTARGASSFVMVR